jgi:hypothetical protein
MFDAAAHTLDDLVLDLLEWLGSNPRPYSEVLDAWRTSCPRLPVWEVAHARGFIVRTDLPGHGQSVAVSVVGAAYRRKHRQPFPAEKVGSTR